MNIITQFFKKAASNPDVLRDNINRDLIRREAAVGKTVFGPVPKGHEREFFRIDKATWIWQESWTENGNKQTKVTKYVIRDKEIIKSINGGLYQSVSLEEAENFEGAVHLYVERVKKEVYQSISKPAAA